MGFWESTLSSAIGAFVGVIGAFIIARSQTYKSQKLSNIPFYIRFNNAQIYINRFDEKVERILDITQGDKRSTTRILLRKHDYNELKECISKVIKELNSDITEIDYKNFIDNFGSFHKDAPVAYYKDLNFLLLCMCILYNLVLDDSKYLVNELPEKIDIPLYNPKTHKINFWLKRFRKKYKVVKRNLKI